MMENHRTHFFPANNCRVITGLLPTGEYGAYRENEDEGRVRGYGHSRLAAIADLVWAISNTEEEEERNGADFAAEACSSRTDWENDHARDYRKHEAV